MADFYSATMAYFYSAIDTIDTFIAYWDSIRGIPPGVEDTIQPGEGLSFRSDSIHVNVRDGIEIFNDSLQIDSAGISWFNLDDELKDSIREGGSISDISFIWNQDTIVQEGNARVSGVGAWGIIQAISTTPDTFTPQAGMVRSIGTGASYGIYTYDGLCWRQWFPIIDTVNCYGGLFNVDIGPDEDICYTDIDLTANIFGGYPPYIFDWSNDGIGDYDDPQSINVSPLDTTEYIVSVLDGHSSSSTDSIVINVSDCFIRNIGGPSAETGDLAFQKTDSNYIIVGNSGSFGVREDILICEIDKYGSFVSSKVVGRGTVVGERVNQAIKTTDDGFAVTGGSGLFGSQPMIAKFSSSYNFEWAKQILTPGNTESNSLCQSLDKGFYVTGDNGGGDLIILKFDSLGTLSWANTANGGGITNLKGIYTIESSEGGCLVLGSSSVSTSTFILRFNNSGTLLWAKELTGGGSTNTGNSVIELDSGGYLLVGGTDSYGVGSTDIYLVKISSLGVMEWARTIGGPDSDVGYSITKIISGGYILYGRSVSFPETGNIICKISSTFDIEWTYVLSNIAGGGDIGYIEQTLDAGFIIPGGNGSCGAGSPDMCLIKCTSMGTTCSGAFITPSLTYPFPIISDYSPTITPISYTISDITFTETVITPTVTDCCP